MRILFICGCLEPGKDGVGDYVRHLATSMVEQGMDVIAISLYDFYVDSVSEDLQSSGKKSISVLRIPYSLRFLKRLEYSKAKIDDFNPDWLSLQFVPYSFHPKGLPYSLAFILKKIGTNRNWHFMFHELWIGMEMESIKSQYYIGQLQRLIIKYLIKRIRPLRIHTQTRLYQEQLKKLGYKAHYLPLFSNIPNINSRKRGTGIHRKIEEREIRLVMFGNIHHNAPVEQFADDAAHFSKMAKRRIHLTLMGRCGDEQEHWRTVWNSRGLTLDVLGEQSPENISKVFSTATAGITTTPLILVEKSGTVAAMQSHALPVICVSRNWRPRGILNVQSAANIIEYKAGKFTDCIEKIDHNQVELDRALKVSYELILSLSEKFYHGKLQLSLD